jgi:hypothetical protein
MIYQVNSKIKRWCFFCAIPLLFLIGHSSYSANTNNKNDTIYLKIEDIHVSPCKTGKNTVLMSVVNLAAEKMIFAIHIQSNINISASVGRGWGAVFYDTIPTGGEKKIEHSFPFYSDPDDGITLRLQFYQLKVSEKWDFQNYFFTKVYNHQEIAGLCSGDKTFPEISGVNIIDEFRRIQRLLRNEFIPEVWNSFTKSYREAQYQDDYTSFSGKVTKPHPIDFWNAEQFLKLNPQESLELTDGRILLNLTLDDAPWSIYFKYSNDQWKIDWIDGFTTLVDLWTTWPARLLPKMQKVSSEHFDFYYVKDSYAGKTIEDIVKIREDGYKRTCEYLDLEARPRITTVFFNDLATKAYETGHRGKGAAFDTTVIEVYNEEIQAHPFHETVHILTNSVGFPPAIFFEGLAEYLEIALMGKDSTELFEALKDQISNVKQSDKWIPIHELMKFTDIPGPSQADVSYPEAAAFVKFLMDKYGKQRFFSTYRNLINSDEESIITENARKLETIYDLPIDVLVEEFHKYYE